MSPKASRPTLSWIIPMILCQGLVPNHDEDHEPATSEMASLLAGDSGASATAIAHSLTSTRLVPSTHSPDCGSQRETMLTPVLPTCTGISVTTDDDVHVLLRAVTSGRLGLVQERPTKEQHASLVHNGHCFIFDEAISKIIRWTDGRKWANKKVQGKFTVSYEDGNIGPGPRFKKHTYRVQRDNALYHIIAYSTEHSSLTPASKDQRLRGLAFSEGASSSITEGHQFASVHDGVAIAAHTAVSPQSSFAHDESSTSVSPQPWALLVSASTNCGPMSGSLPQPTREGYNQGTQGRHCEPTNEYFRAFIEACPHLWDLPAQLNERKQQYLTRFLSRVAPLHNMPDSACFAATETFALDHEGTPSILAFLAVLRDQYDIFRPDQKVDSAIRCRNELSCDFVVLPISTLNTSTAFSWLDIQELGSHFRCERLKRAAWALGQLPPGSHASDSPSFKWVRQVWNREPLRSGSRLVVDLCSGDGRQQWPPLRRLKTRLYHPANLALNSELMSVLDEQLRVACKDSLQEWCIALIYQLSQRTAGEWEPLIDSYRTYMEQVVELQVDAFYKTGYTEVLHTCQNDACHHGKPSMNDVKDKLIHALHSLADSLLQGLSQGHFLQGPYPNYMQKQYVEILGLQCYWLQSSYVLLSPVERLHYDCLCRTSLNASRAELTRKAGGWDVLIWNYLPDHIQAWASNQRKLLEANVY